MLRLVRLDEGDHGATEATTGHAGAVGTRLACGVDRRVELRDGHLVVVAQRIVRGVQQVPELPDVIPHGARGEQCIEVLHPLDLADRVAGTSAHDLVLQARRQRVELGGIRVAERRHAQGGGGALAVCPSGRVLAIDVGVLGAGIGDQQRESLGGEVPRDRAGREVAAVQEQRMPGAREHRGGLVQPSGRGTGEVGLGRDRGADPLKRRGAQRQQGLDRLRRGALESGGAGEPGAERHLAVDHDVHALGGGTGDVRPQRPQHPGHIRGPAVDGPGLEVAGMDLQDLVVLGGPQADEVGGRARGGREAPMGDRHRQAQAVLVVDVLADDVHASRGGPHTVGGVAERLGEQRLDSLGGLTAIRRRGQRHGRGHGDRGARASGVCGGAGVCGSGHGVPPERSKAGARGRAPWQHPARRQRV
ncbi:hypothetical protein FM103_07710 [Corynebacterium xerosis]|nr:hypothetical protein FM103_07710 [Corynebacterium xerosis]